MSVDDLSFIAACARARTHSGLEAILRDHGVRVRRPHGEWRCRSSKYSARVIDAALAIALEHIEVLSRVADLNRRSTKDSEVLRDELRRVVLPASIVANSRAMRRIFHELLPAVARTDTTVLIRGETGTGKEVIARHLHALSARSHRPFLAVNCGALPQTLIESALFGHERGAFTGAERTQPGLFERADGGTLFLDEIGELPLHAQVKLLRVLQDGEVERVGASERRRVDVRVVAATHRPLESMIEREKFRADLFYRLNVFPIDVPPLRERPEDLQPLVAAILQRLAARQRRLVPRVTAVALRRLERHTWPGNVRELENVLERAMLLSSDADAVLVLPDGFEREAPAPTRKVATFADASRAAIRAALAASGGRIYGANGAARALGLEPSTLQSKMLKLGITRRSGMMRRR